MTFDHFRKALGKALMDAKPAVITAAQHYCEECREHHFIESFCPVCGACLYKHGDDMKDPMFPLWRCRICHSVHLWD